LSVWEKDKVARPEAILKEISVVARLRLGTERLKLFLTNDRIIVAHLGKRGTVALATTSFFGRLSGAIEDLFKGSKESLGKRKLASLTPREILGNDKDNFAIAYDDIVRVDVDEMPSSTGVTILTKGEKFEFFTRLGQADVVGFFSESLGTKVTTKGFT